MKYNCLIVDDEIELAQNTKEYFEMFDVSCYCASSIEEYQEFAKENEVELVLLDINLDGESGFELCKVIRATSNIPILFISARQSDDDILIALNIGGDDYVKKPYSLGVLLAKVKVILNRIHQHTWVPEETEVGGVKLIEDKMQVNVNGKVVQLKAREYKLFSYLFQHANKIVTKDELFTAVWGNQFFSDGTLNVHIRKLREKIEENPNEPKMIKTIWGTGYILEL